MLLPHGLSEETFLSTVRRVADALAPSFAFGGCFTAEDLRQEAVVMAIDAVARWDGRRPLENMLYIHVKNRFRNLRRDRCRRADPPCRHCHQTPDGHTNHPDGRHCRRYKTWAALQDSKSSLARVQAPRTEDYEPPTVQPEAELDAEVREVLAAVGDRLAVDLRADWLRLRSGRPVPKSRRHIVEQEVCRIMTDLGFEVRPLEGKSMWAKPQPCLPATPILPGDPSELLDEDTAPADAASCPGDDAAKGSLRGGAEQGEPDEDGEEAGSECPQPADTAQVAEPAGS